MKEKEIIRYQDQLTAMLKVEERDAKKFEDLETRTFALEFERAEGDEDDRRVSLSFASEEPVMRSFGWEVFLQLLF